MDVGQIRTIIEGRIAGKTVRQLAKETGTSKSAVAYQANKDNIKAIIEGAAEVLYEQCVPRATSNIIEIVHSDDPGDKELKLKYSEKVLQGPGIMASPTQSVYITQINNNSISVMPEEIKHLLGNREAATPVIDAEYEDITD